MPTIQAHDPNSPDDLKLADLYQNTYPRISQALDLLMTASGTDVPVTLKIGARIIAPYGHVDGCYFSGSDTHLVVTLAGPRKQPYVLRWQENSLTLDGMPHEAIEFGNPKEPMDDQETALAQQKVAQIFAYNP